eukprot:51209-Eustigmatos_ZCMA.PRE.1
MVYRDLSRNWQEEHMRIRKLASALYKSGVRPGEIADDHPQQPGCTEQNHVQAGYICIRKLGSRTVHHCPS